MGDRLLASSLRTSGAGCIANLYTWRFGANFYNFAHGRIIVSATSVLGQCCCFTFLDGLLDIVCRRNSQSARGDVAVEYPRQRTSPFARRPGSGFLASMAQLSCFCALPYLYSFPPRSPFLI